MAAVKTAQKFRFESENDPPVGAEGQWELQQLINKLEDGLKANSGFIKQVKHPQLLILALRELNDLIGNDIIKGDTAAQISHLILCKTRMAKNPQIKQDEVMLNTVLYGDPGVGKTLIAKKLAKIWYALGMLENKSRPAVRRLSPEQDELADLLAGNDITTYENAAFVSTVILFGVILIVLALMLLSAALRFYRENGGKWTAIAVGIVAFIIICSLILIYYGTRKQENTQTTVNKNQPKIIKNTDNNKRNDLLTNYVAPPDEQLYRLTTSTDFIAPYVGQTAAKTRAVLKSCLGKTLIIDEFYEMISYEGGANFGTEALTEINAFMSEHPTEITIVVCGYKDKLEKKIFKAQPGLDRRFTWKFTCPGYTGNELFYIFKYKVENTGWKLYDENAIKKIIDKEKSRGGLKNYGGDCERLVFLSKMEHSNRYIKGDNLDITSLYPEHVQVGIKKLRENEFERDLDQKEDQDQDQKESLLKMLSQIQRKN